MSEQTLSPDHRALIERRANRIRGMEELIGEQLRPPSLEDDERLYLMTSEELMQRYESRVEYFQRLLDAERSGTPLTQEEVHTMKMWLRAVNGMDRYLTEALNESGEGSILTDEQLQAFQGIHTALETGHSSGYVALPTGGGKTVIFSEMVKAMRVPTLIAVPTLDLVTQTRGKLRRFAPSIDTGMVMGGTRKMSEEATVITYDSLCNLVEKGDLNPEQFSCLILDEAHLALSPRRQVIVNRFSRAIRIGFTATPDYAETKKLADLLPHEIHRLSILEAVEKRVICGFRIILAQTRFSIDGVRTTDQKGYDKKQLEKAINIEARNRSAVELYRELADQGQKAIVFCAGINHAIDTASTFRAAGISAEHIYGEMGKGERKAILRRSQSGEVRVLCGADLLVCGYDDPEIQFVFLLTESQSVVQVTQSVGRGLRQKFQKGVPQPKQATIVQFIDRYSSPAAAPVLFSDIAGGAVMLPSGSQTSEDEGAGNKKAQAQPLPKIDVTGLKVITDAAEVMRVTRETIRAKELFGMKPNEDGWFVIDESEYGTIQRCAKDVGMTPKAARAYLSQAEAGGRTFATEEKHGPSGVTDLFLRSEMVQFLRERSGTNIPVAGEHGSPELEKVKEMQKYDAVPEEGVLFAEGEELVCEIAGEQWASEEYIADRLSIKAPVVRRWLTSVRRDLIPIRARREVRKKMRSSPSMLLTKVDVPLYPLGVIEQNQAFIVSQVELYNEQEDQRKQSKKALHERIRARGWFRRNGVVYVNSSWITQHLRPPSQIPSFNSVASKVFQLPTQAVTVGDLGKFYPLSTVYKAYKTVPHGGRHMTEQWRNELSEPSPEAFTGDEGDEPVEIVGDGKE